MPGPVEAKKSDQKMVPLSDLVTYKNSSADREKKLKGQLEELRGKLSEVEAEKEMRKMGEEDDDVSAVKQDLLRQSKEQREKDRASEMRETTLNEREGVVRAKELVADYKQRGVEIDIETLGAEEDMERYSLDRWAEHLAKEEQKQKEGTPEPSGVFETSMAATHKKMPKDMTDEEFVDLEKDLKAKARLI